MTDNVVVGHLCQDPVLRQPKRGGRPVARFTVAVNIWRRVGEEFVDRPPVFHRVVCFGPLAENVSNSLRKGMEVLAVGEWVDDSYQDEQGKRRVQHALEAKVVGPALRRATASVVRVARPADEPNAPVPAPVPASVLASASAPVRGPVPSVAPAPTPTPERESAVARAG